MANGHDALSRSDLQAMKFKIKSESGNRTNNL